MKWLGLIPARAGSRRLPKKNMAMVGGLPLVGHAIEHSIKSGVMADTFVSSDDPEVLRFAVENGAMALVRPDHLSGPEVPMIDVVRYMALVYADQAYDAVMLLQPTSPLRTAKDVEAAASMLEATGADSVISVCRAPGEYALKFGHAGRLRIDSSIVVPNGAIYAISTDALARGEDWYTGICYGYEMPRERSIDIDTIVELEQARAQHGV